MSSPINNPNPLLAAQMISYAKGQENQSRQSSEEKERRRLDNLKLQQAVKQQQTQNQTASMQKGFLA
jgi:hypothetical protein